jgi:hypothetical protein
MRFQVLQLAGGHRAAPLARTSCLGLAVAYSVLALGPFNVLERSYNMFRTGANAPATIFPKLSDGRQTRPHYCQGMASPSPDPQGYGQDDGELRQAAAATGEPEVFGVVWPCL